METSSDKGRLTQGTLLYEGKAKRVFATDDPTKVILAFKDDATAFNGVKRAVVEGKGELNCRFSTLLLGEAERAGVPVHLVEVLSPREILCNKVQIIPVEVVVRNRVAGGFARRYGLAEGTPLARPLVEYFYKSDALDDPLVTAEVAVRLGWAEAWELAYLEWAALKVNDVLSRFWAGHGIDLIDFKLEFGRFDGRLLLADEITPDGSRLWEQGTGRRLDKDVFRRDLADLGETYRELAQRLFGR